MLDHSSLVVECCNSESLCFRKQNCQIFRNKICLYSLILEWDHIFLYFPRLNNLEKQPTRKKKQPLFFSHLVRMKNTSISESRLTVTKHECKCWFRLSIGSHRIILYIRTWQKKTSLLCLLFNHSFSMNWISFSNTLNRKYAFKEARNEKFDGNFELCISLLPVNCAH